LETLVAGTISVTVAGFAYFGRRAIDFFFSRSPVNMSATLALSVAHETLGSSVIKAIPFREKNSREQFIAVLLSGTSERDPATVRVLQGYDRIFEIQPTTITAFDELATSSGHSRPLVGIVDINHDGTNRVFAITRESAPDDPLYAIQIDLYDPTTRIVYSLLTGGGWDAATFGNSEVSSSAEKEPTIEAWLFGKANEFLRTDSEVSTPE